MRLNLRISKLGLTSRNIYDNIIKNKTRLIKNEE